MVGKKLRELRIDAAAHQTSASTRMNEKAARGPLVANAELTASYDALNNSGTCNRPKRSAQAACEKGNFASAESLKILAMIYASQCNFDRAEFYQKLAVIFASEDERPAVLQTLEHYRKMGQLVTEKKQAKTPPSPPGQGKGRIIRQKSTSTSE